MAKYTFLNSYLSSYEAQKSLDRPLQKLPKAPAVVRISSLTYLIAIDLYTEAINIPINRPLAYIVVVWRNRGYVSN